MLRKRSSYSNECFNEDGKHIHLYRDSEKGDVALRQTLNEELRANGYDVARLQEGRKMVLITGHRRENFEESLSGVGNLFFIEPLEYLSFVYLMEQSTIVLTDSGAFRRRHRDWGSRYW